MTLPSIILLGVAAQAGAPEASAAPAHQPAPWVRGALETGLVTMPVGEGPGLFAALTPMVGLTLESQLALEVGAPLRIRWLSAASASGAHPTHWLRPEDWDERSDWGQLLRQLRIGEEGAPFYLEAGPIALYSLGHGHLINRYSNRENANYHPAGASLAWFWGPTRTQAFVSDLLGARLFAAEVTADLGRLAGAGAPWFDRFHLGLSAAHDAGQAGGAALPLSAMHLDLDAALYRSTSFQAFLVAGAGARLGTPSVALGAVLGLTLDGRAGTTEWGAKLEGRKQGGGFRQGLFGPSYELSRFAGTGFSGVPLALEPLPDGYSGYAEWYLRTGASSSLGRGAQWGLSAAVEYFSSRRADLDLSVTMGLLEGRAAGVARASVVGWGALPRYAFNLEARYRVRPSVYLSAQGGTVFYPLPDGSLSRGLGAGLGAGLDFER